MNKFNKLFSNKKPIIGMIHFPPLLGCGDYPGFEIALRDALADLKALTDGGVDAIMIENNYDQPHRAVVSPQVVSILTLLAKEIRQHTSLPIGISVLWNDYRAALSIAKVTDLQFVRVPAFVDTVETKYGIIEAVNRGPIEFRRKIEAEEIAILADVHVKHSKLVSPHTLEQSVQLAEQAGADGIIVTGTWTGDAPVVADLETAEATTHLPVIIGSGANAENLQTLAPRCDAIIVSTSLKVGAVDKNEENMKPWTQRVSVKKTKEFMKALAQVS